ncbi:MAG: 4Fe-4S binding protein [Lachnospiraceae bacterium]|nr:4Fe-4S binding protein [Lachnospiraceae bacterium]
MNEKSDNTMKKQGRIRLWFQAAWFVLTNGYIRGYTKGQIFNGNTKVLCLPGLNCYSCPGALASCPMGALQAILGNASYRMSLYVFGLLGAFGVVFGRLVCGWMCPFGFFQDLLYKIKIKVKKKNLPGHKYLKYLRYVILVLFPILLVSMMLDATGTSMPWFCEWICPSGMLLGAIPLVLLNTGLRAAIGARFMWKLFLLLAIAVLSVIYYRPFCKYLCPLGAIYGLFNPISSYRLVIDQDKCISCGKCQRVCGMDIKTFESPNNPDCIRCGSCIAACPTGAIESTWHKTGQKIRSRCFVDDGDILSTSKTDAQTGPSSAAASAGLQPVGLWKPLYLGALMIIAGAFTLFKGSGNIVVENLLSHFRVEIYHDMNVAAAFMGLFWCVSSIIILLTGLYTVRFRQEPERLLSVNEKLRSAWFIALLGLIIGIAGVLADLRTFSNTFFSCVYDTYVYVWLPFMMLQVWLMCQEIRGKKTNKVLWVILSIVNLLLAFSSIWVEKLFILVMS